MILNQWLFGEILFWSKRFFFMFRYKLTFIFVIFGLSLSIKWIRSVQCIVVLNCLTWTIRLSFGFQMILIYIRFNLLIVIFQVYLITKLCITCNLYVIILAIIRFLWFFTDMILNCIQHLLFDRNRFVCDIICRLNWFNIFIYAGFNYIWC